MFRALSTRRSKKGYEQLGSCNERSSTTDNYFVPYLSRAKSLPAQIIGSSSSKRVTSTSKAPPEEIKKASKIHPFFSMFETRRKKKATAKPEFSRYLEYLKEGGWNMGC